MSEKGRQFSLRHVKHESKMNNTLYSMFLDQSLVDVMLSSDSTNISAHRLILSANSSYFKKLFDALDSNRCQIPIIILKDVPLYDLKAIMEFIYKGEVSVEERQLSSVLNSAELLQVFGLTEVCHALRSRLNNETNSESIPVSGLNRNPQKRPRISDGIQQTSQQSNPSDLFSRLNNARFDIRSNQLTAISPSISPNQQHLRSVPTATTSPTVVQNVILPSTQIHRKSDSNISDLTQKPNKTLTNSPFDSIRVISSPESGTERVSTLKTYSVGTHTAKQKPKTMAQNNSGTLSTWTPSNQTLDPLPSSSGIQDKVPVEVLIDDENNESLDYTEEMDVKPPIFELNRNLNSNNDIVILDIESDSNKNDPQIEVSKKPKHKTTETVKSSLRNIKSRSSSTSSQSSLPPPPSYRVVQRSSSRLLRNIIKPTAVSSSSDDKNKPNVKKENKTVRLIRQKANKSNTDLNRSREESPEVECPSCGLKFTDDKKWNEHITKAHPPVQT